MADKFEHAFFYNSVEHDRVYDADSFSELFRKFFTTGVFTGDLQVTAGEGMKVTVGSGYCNINGKVKLWQSPQTLDITTAHASYDRIDTVVIERNDTDRDFRLKAVTGSATDSPRATAPVRGGEIYQLVLAQISVKAGATKITQADITDTRADTSLCGTVAAAVKEVDFSQFTKQFEGFFENYRESVKKAYDDYAKDIAGYEARQKLDFESWFDTVKGQLSGDVAGNLQKEIDELRKGNTFSVVSVELTAEGWTGEEAPYSQTVPNGSIRDGTVMLVSALADGADEATQKAYVKAFGIVSSGTAATSEGSVTFKVYKKPETTLTVGLLRQG